ncbi:hydroxyisourate hydrolase [Aestuariispira insulae]|uniref:5-hydroxyisourate hydrolase n=1 Tax=Aestuariispira insulae TaxID=1461337 RepID=A0A3D9HWT1_9PROT|nr:hydroxyisourate hydrolase [Aestuariispira insulae]RED53860.1 5-hydroxyisourate hydrolase [Aestuariispira insulae]
MGRLTTHVLDTARGCPGQGIKIELFRLDSGRELVTEAVTNDDGRCDAPILEGEAFTAGKYELVFHAGSYFDAQGYDLPEPKFLDEVSLRFGIAQAGEHYHVPLLLSPFSFSTYRGS